MWVFLCGWFPEIHWSFVLVETIRLRTALQPHKELKCCSSPQLSFAFFHTSKIIFYFILFCVMSMKLRSWWDLLRHLKRKSKNEGVLHPAQFSIPKKFSNILEMQQLECFSCGRMLLSSLSDCINNKKKDFMVCFSCFMFQVYSSHFPHYLVMFLPVHRALVWN